MSLITVKNRQLSTVPLNFDYSRARLAVNTVAFGSESVNTMFTKKGKRPADCSALLLFACNKAKSRGYKTVFHAQLSMKFILLINVKMPTIVGILTILY